MRYAVSLPNFVPRVHAGDVDLHRYVEWARMAETSGWDAFFVWDHLLFWKPGTIPYVEPEGMALRLEKGTDGVWLGDAPLAPGH